MKNCSRWRNRRGWPSRTPQPQHPPKSKARFPVPPPVEGFSSPTQILVNSRLAYVAVSRGRYDAQIYTNDAEKLGAELSRDVSKQSAMETEHESVSRDQGHATENAAHQSVSESHEHGEGYGMGH